MMFVEYQAQFSEINKIISSEASPTFGHANANFAVL